MSRYELEGLRKLAQYLLAETAFLDSKNGTADKRRQVRQDIPSTITAPIELVLELANAVSKVLGAGAVNTQIKDEPTKRSLKVKLKVQPTKEMAKPRLKLKMKEPLIGRSKKEDDDFVYDDSQYFDEEIDEESLAVEDDDDEYVQGDAPGRHKPVKKTPPAPKRKRGEKKPYQDDSSDDGLGTGKVKTKRASNKGVDDAASDKKTKGSVKQRLLNRIRKK